MRSSKNSLLAQFFRANTPRNVFWLAAVHLMLFESSGFGQMASRRISGGDYHTVALKADGTAWTWGHNYYYQLGDGTVNNRLTPGQVLGVSGAVSIAAGGYHTLAIKNDGTVWAWGYGSNGELGDGASVPRSTAIQTYGLSGVTFIGAGINHSLAAKSDGTVWAWGLGIYGQLGDGASTSRSTPVQVSTLSGVIAVAGGALHSLALKSDGTVWAWGDNASGQVGDGTTTTRTAPVQVSGLSGVIAIASGSYFSLALKADGTVWAWGLNSSGQLGDGTTTTRTAPIQVSSLSSVCGIEAGTAHGLALKSDGTVRAWGLNASGQLGDGTTTSRTTPVSVSALSYASGIAAGGSQSFALTDCYMNSWGNNSYYGMLGDGTTTSRSVPVMVMGLVLCNTFYGPLAVYQQNDLVNPAIFLDPNAVGGPLLGVAGTVATDSLQVSGAASIAGPVSLGTPLGTASGGIGMNAGSLPADQFLYTTSVGVFGGAPVTSFARSLLAGVSAASIRGTLGVAHIPFATYSIVEENQNYGSLGSPASAGSGITYWPNRNTFLILDNTISAPKIYEFNRNGTVSRTLTLTGFADAEDIHWISGNTFAIAQEYNTTAPTSVDEIVVIDLPTSGTAVNITSATRRLAFAGTIVSRLGAGNGNLGIEGFAVVGDYFYFTTESYTTTPSPDWNVWKIQNIGNGPVTPTKAFRLNGLTNGVATDISGMATDGVFLYLLSHEGASVNGLGRLLKTTVDGRLLEQSPLPSFSGGGMWSQAEGIELFADTDGKLKMVITGETSASSPGVDFMLLSPP